MSRAARAQGRSSGEGGRERTKRIQSHVRSFLQVPFLFPRDQRALSGRETRLPMPGAAVLRPIASPVLTDKKGEESDSSKPARCRATLATVRRRAKAGASSSAVADSSISRSGYKLGRGAMLALDETEPLLDLEPFPIRVPVPATWGKERFPNGVIGVMGERGELGVCAVNLTSGELLSELGGEELASVRCCWSSG